MKCANGMPESHFILTSANIRTYNKQNNPRRANLAGNLVQRYGVIGGLFF